MSVFQVPDAGELRRLGVVKEKVEVDLWREFRELATKTFQSFSMGEVGVSPQRARRASSVSIRGGPRLY